MWVQKEWRKASRAARQNRSGVQSDRFTTTAKSDNISACPVLWLPGNPVRGSKGCRRIGLDEEIREGPLQLRCTPGTEGIRRRVSQKARACARRGGRGLMGEQISNERRCNTRVRKLGTPET